MSNFWSLGVPQRLKNSSGNDTRTKLYIDEEHVLFDIVSQINQQIRMPTKNYVVTGMKPKQDQYSPDPYYEFGTHWNVYVANANGDYLVTSLSKGTSDYNGEEPGVLVLPEPKKLPTLTAKITEFFGGYYGIYKPGADWQEADQFYPQKDLRRLTKEIADIRANAESEATAKQLLIDAHKQEWNFLRYLVTEQGEKLVDAVYKVLADALGLEVINSDEEKSGEPVEDLLVKFDDRAISIEVKGTTKSNAPLEYTQQPFQHIVRRNDDGKVEPALILNHDMKKDPQFRKAAYTDKDKVALIANLYFIDTRVLLAIAIDVIDGKLTQQEAVNILFGARGRVEYVPESLENQLR